MCDQNKSKRLDSLEINGLEIGVGWWSLQSNNFSKQLYSQSSNLNGKSMGGREYNAFLLSTR